MAIDEAQAMRLLALPGLYSIVIGPYGPAIYCGRLGEECLAGHLWRRLTAGWLERGFLVEQEDTRGRYMLATRLAYAEAHRRRFGALPPLSTLKRTMASVQITTMLDALCIDYDLPTAFQIQVPRHGQRLCPWRAWFTQSRQLGRSAAGAYKRWSNPARRCSGIYNAMLLNV